MADQPHDTPREDDTEVELDIRAFLPEEADLDGDWGDDAPEPEMPSWARSDAGTSVAEPDAPPAVTNVEAAAVVEMVVDSQGERAGDPEVTERGVEESIDLSVLEGIEADLLEVDEAIAALDAGEPDRSALLRSLLQARPAP